MSLETKHEHLDKEIQFSKDLATKQRTVQQSRDHGQYNTDQESRFKTDINRRIRYGEGKLIPTESGNISNNLDITGQRKPDTPVIVPQGTVVLTSAGSIENINYVFHAGVGAMGETENIKVSHIEQAIET